MPPRSFNDYFVEGIAHLLDWQAYDHMLFLAVLVVAYAVKEWRKVAWMVTAFTLGHSVSLVFATQGWLDLPGALTEFCIALSIFLTAVTRLVFVWRSNKQVNFWMAWMLILAVGIIHGLGFSGQLLFYLQTFPGEEVSIGKELLAFNLGLEVGQLVFVAVFMFVGHLLTMKVHQRQKIWKITVATLAAIISLLLLAQRKFW